MTTLSLRTLCAVIGLATVSAACNRSDNPPNPPKSALGSPAGSLEAGQPDRSLPSSASGPAADGRAAPSQGMAGVAGSSAAGSTIGPGSIAGPVAGADRAFVADAANNAMAEVEAARLVAGRSEDPGIKTYAQQMERDHASTNDELKRIASQKGIDLPTTIGGEPRGQLSRLTTLSQGEVDRAFLQDFGVQAHQKAIGLFERQARDGQDPELRAFAERTLPRLREHLAMAQQMQTGQGVSPNPAGPAGPIGSMPPR